CLEAWVALLPSPVVGIYFAFIVTRPPGKSKVSGFLLPPRPPAAAFVPRRRPEGRKTAQKNRARPPPARAMAVSCRIYWYAPPGGTVRPPSFPASGPAAAAPGRARPARRVRSTWPPRRRAAPSEAPARPPA